MPGLWRAAPDPPGGLRARSCCLPAHDAGATDRVEQPSFFGTRLPG